MVKLELSQGFKEKTRGEVILEELLGIIPPEHLELVDKIIVDSVYDNEGFLRELWGNTICTKGGPVAHAEYEEGNGTIIRIDYKLTEGWGPGFARTLFHEISHVVGHFLHGDSSEEFADRYADSLYTVENMVKDVEADRGG